MKNIAVIAGYDRPEYMEVTLTLLRECNGAKDLHYVFALDYGYHKKNKEVIDRLFQGFSYEYLHNNGTKYRFMKQSFNVLQSYLYAASTADEFIFLIEDDIFCAKSFFEVHYKLHEKEIFCSTACMLQNKPELHGLNISGHAFTKESVYQSLGVCFRKKIIQEHVSPHVNDSYFINPRVYLKKTFDSHLNNDYCEQDGLIRRIHDESGLEIGFPSYPRAYHAGIWGYHRQGEKVRSWTHEQKVKFIMDTCFSQSKMQKYNQYNDVFVTDLSV
jgi:hypothetical protein